MEGVAGVILGRLGDKIMRHIFAKISSRVRNHFLEEVKNHLKIKEPKIEKIDDATKHGFHQDLYGIVSRYDIDNDSDEDVKFEKILVTIYVNDFPIYNCNEFAMGVEQHHHPDKVIIYRETIPKKEEGWLRIYALIPKILAEKYDEALKIRIEGNIEFRTGIGCVFKEIPLPSPGYYELHIPKHYPIVT